MQAFLFASSEALQDVEANLLSLVSSSHNSANGYKLGQADVDVKELSEKKHTLVQVHRFHCFGVQEVPSFLCTKFL